MKNKEGRRTSHSYCSRNPWSKGNYSRHIREASMVERRLPEVGPPSGRVPGSGLLVVPILEARRRRNRGEIAKKGSRPEGFTPGGKKGGRGEPRGDQGPQAPPPPRRGQGWGHAGWP